MKTKMALLLAAMLASGSSLANDTYQVTTSIYANGELVAAPNMVVEAEKTASIHIEPDLKYQLTLTPQSNNSVAILTRVTTNNKTINPSFLVDYNKEATVVIGSQKLTVLVNKIGS